MTDKKIKKRLVEHFGDLHYFRKCGKVPKWLQEKIGDKETLAVFLGSKYFDFKYYIVVYPSGRAQQYFDLTIPKVKRHFEANRPEDLKVREFDVFPMTLDADRIMAMLGHE